MAEAAYVQVLAQFDYCCHEMQVALENYVLELWQGGKDSPAGIYIAEDGSITDTQVRFCPFCGKPIVIQSEERDG